MITLIIIIIIIIIAMVMKKKKTYFFFWGGDSSFTSVLYRRANIVVKGCRPYEEDHWRGILIRDSYFELVKVSSNCSVCTGINGHRSKSISSHSCLYFYISVALFSLHDSHC